MLTGKYYINAAGDPFFNMLFDDWLFEKVRINPEQIFLRLYTWSKEAITIGFNQKREKAIKKELLDQSIPIIRRVTGGRAIFHDPSELTFTLAANLEILPAEYRSLPAANRLISESLVEIFDSLGLVTNWQKNSDRRFVESSENRPRACFESVSRFEILASSGKIAGGAQRRLGNSFIHQGSLKLNGITFCAAIGQGGSSLNPAFTGGSKPISLNDVREPMNRVFSHRLGVQFKEEHLQINELIDLENRLKDFLQLSLSRRPAD